MKVFQRLGLAVLAILILAACSDGGGPAASHESPSPAPSDPSEAAASIVTSATSVFFDEEVTLEVNLASANIADAIVNWSIDGGALSTTTGAKTVWTAPRDEGNFAITADIDVNGESLTATADISVSADPAKNYLVVQASHGQTKRAADGSITTTFGLEVGLSAKVIGPDGENPYIEWDLVSGGGSFTGFVNEPTVTWKAPERTGSAVIQATTKVGGETLIEELAIDVIEPLMILEITPENPSVGMGNEVTIEVELGGYFQDEADVVWGYTAIAISPINPIFFGSITPHEGNDRLANFRAPKVEGSDRFDVSVEHDGRTYESARVDVEVGICDDGDFTSASDPCQIQNVYQLQAIKASQERMRGHYIVTGDIDASDTASWNQGKGFIPLMFGSAAGFSGTFDGGNHTISNLKIKNSEQENAPTGIFAVVNQGVIQNLVITDSAVEGQKLVGLLAGSARSATFKNIEIQNSKVHGRLHVGGLAGIVLPPSQTDNPEGEFTNVSVSNLEGILSGGILELGGIYGGLGGVVGVLHGANITDARLENDSTLVGSSDNVGGIAGIVGPSASIINATVVDSSVTAISHPNVPRTSRNIGGVVGWNHGPVRNVNVHRSKVSASGKYIGGVVGLNDSDGTITDTGISDGSEVIRLGMQRDAIGGFAGRNAGAIEDAWVEDVTVRSVFGAAGFVGTNMEEASISRASVSDSVVKLDESLHVETPPVSREFVSGFGALNYGTISLSSVQKTEITGAHKAAAGFVVFNLPTGNIRESFVYMPNTSIRTTRGQIGGFTVDNSGELDHVYAILNEVAGYEQDIGGLTAVQSEGAWIKQSYAHTNVRLVDGDPVQNFVGPLVGFNVDLHNNNNHGKVQTSFWSPDIARSAPLSNNGGIEISATEFLLQSTFANRTHYPWKFDGSDAKWVMPSTSNPGPHTPDLINNSRYK